MSTPGAHIHGHHQTNWNRLVAIGIFLVVIALVFIGVMMYLNTQAINNTATETQTESDANSAQSDDCTREELQSLVDTYGWNEELGFYSKKTGCTIGEVGFFLNSRNE